MPRPGAIDPATGKRYDWIPPEKRSAAAQVAETAKQDDEHLKLLKRQRAAMQAQTSLLAYTRYTMPDPEAPADVERSLYDAQRFHEEVAKALEDVERGEIRQLIFCMPPRHGKTELATKRFCAWLHGKHPEWDIIVATYSDEKAMEFGGDTRAILSSPQHKQVFPGYGLRRGGTAKDFMQSNRGGKVLFKGRGGALTGSGMHVGLADDLFKDHEEARSKAIRDQAWNWFTKVFMTRRMGKKLVILTMTRWHSDDVIGRLTDPENPDYPGDKEAAKWKIIRLPALAEEDDPLGRKLGEPLWPLDDKGEAKYDLEFLQGQRALDPLGFEALYQQSPTVADGVLFRRENIRYYKPRDLPDELRIYCASDHAVGTKQRNDPSCFIKIGVDRQDNIYLLDCWWKRGRTDEAVEAMLTMGGGEQRPLIWWAERGHISGSIGPFLRKRMAETGQYINVQEVTPKADKEQRAQSIAARVAMGKVLWPEGLWWTEKSINELLSFPSGLHDDFVDALAYIGLGLPRQVRASAPSKADEAPKFGTLGWVKWTEKWQGAERDRKARGGF